MRWKDRYSSLLWFYEGIETLGMISTDLFRFTLRHGWNSVRPFVTHKSGNPNDANSPKSLRIGLKSWKMTKNTSKNGLSWLSWQNNFSFYHFTQIRCIPIQILIIQRFSDIELGLPVLYVTDAVAEIKKGCASLISVECYKCGRTNKISTSRQHHSGRRGPGAYDINTQIALGAIDSCIGYTHVSNFFTTLTVPTINRSAYKRREREIGLAVEEVAIILAEWLCKMKLTLKNLMGRALTLMAWYLSLFHMICNG